MDFSDFFGFFSPFFEIFQKKIWNFFPDLRNLFKKISIFFWNFYLIYFMNPFISKIWIKLTIYIKNYNKINIKLEIIRARNLSPLLIFVIRRGRGFKYFKSVRILQWISNFSFVNSHLFHITSGEIFENFIIEFLKFFEIL